MDFEKNRKIKLDFRNIYNKVSIKNPLTIFPKDQGIETFSESKENFDKLNDGTFGKIVDNCSYIKNVFLSSHIQCQQPFQITVNIFDICAETLPLKAYAILEAHDQIYKLITKKKSNYDECFGKDLPFINALRGLRSIMEHQHPLDDKTLGNIEFPDEYKLNFKLDFRYLCVIADEGIKKNYDLENEEIISYYAFLVHRYPRLDREGKVIGDHNVLNFDELYVPVGYIQKALFVILNSLNALNKSLE